MPVDYYLGRSVEELTALLRSAQERKARGNITEVTAAGVRTVRDFGQNKTVEEEIFRLRWSLYRATKDDPNSIWTDPRLERITRTRVDFSQARNGGG